MNSITSSQFLSIIKVFDCIYVESILMKAYCIFDNPETDMFMWVSPFNDKYIKFYRKNNLNIEYDLSNQCFYINDEYSIIFRIEPTLNINKKDES